MNAESWQKSSARPRLNSFAGWPAMHGLGRFYELEVHCRGEPDPVSGYVMNVSHIDVAVRERVLPLIAEAIERDASAHPGRLLPKMLSTLDDAIAAKVTLLRWWLTPYHALAMDTQYPGELLISDTFDFAASHRLHCPELSSKENERLFGKCNNANGHGHNYRVRPVVAIDSAECIAAPFNLEQLQAIVLQQVIERFDHKHLNEDVEEFAELNPSVEHITRLCFDLLVGEIQSAGGRLLEVTVWETDKTSCTYRGPACAV